MVFHVVCRDILLICWILSWCCCKLNCDCYDHINHVVKEIKKGIIYNNDKYIDTITHISCFLVPKRMNVFILNITENQRIDWVLLNDLLKTVVLSMENT